MNVVSQIDGQTSKKDLSQKCVAGLHYQLDCAFGVLKSYLKELEVGWGFYPNLLITSKFVY
jgi:hypothetical protein